MRNRIKRLCRESLLTKRRQRGRLVAGRQAKQKDLPLTAYTALSEAHCQEERGINAKKQILFQ